MRSNSESPRVDPPDQVWGRTLQVLHDSQRIWNIAISRVENGCKPIELDVSSYLIYSNFTPERACLSHPRHARQKAFLARSIPTVTITLGSPSERVDENADASIVALSCSKPQSLRVAAHAGWRSPFHSLGVLCTLAQPANYRPSDLLSSNIGIHNPGR